MNSYEGFEVDVGRVACVKRLGDYDQTGVEGWRAEGVFTTDGGDVFVVYSQPEATAFGVLIASRDDLQKRVWTLEQKLRDARKNEATLAQDLIELRRKYESEMMLPKMEAGSCLALDPVDSERQGEP